MLSRLTLAPAHSTTSFHLIQNLDPASLGCPNDTAGFHTQSKVLLNVAVMVVGHNCVIGHVHYKQILT